MIGYSTVSLKTGKLPSIVTIELLYFLTKSKEKLSGVQPSTRHILFPNLASLTHMAHNPHRFVHKSTFLATDDPTKVKQRQELHFLSLKLISVITLRRPMWIRRAETKPSSLHISDSKAVFRIGSKTTIELLSGNLFLKQHICPIERKAIEGWAIEHCSYLLKTGKFKLFCKLGIL